MLFFNEKRGATAHIPHIWQIQRSEDYMARRVGEEPPLVFTVSCRFGVFSGPTQPESYGKWLGGPENPRTYVQSQKNG